MSATVFTVSVVASTAATAAFNPPNSLLRIKLIKGPPKVKLPLYQLIKQYSYQLQFE